MMEPEVQTEVDPRRQALLERLAKARAARMANLAARAAGTEVAEPKYPRPKHRRKKAKKPRKTTFRKLATEAAEHGAPRAPHAKPPVPDGWLNGISAAGCPPACNTEKCVITGENVCGHPHMGGLQSKYLSGEFKDVIARYGEAKLEISRLAAERKVK